MSSISLNSVFSRNGLTGPYLKFQVNSFYGSQGGLQFIGVISTSTPVPKYTRRAHLIIPFLQVKVLETGCDADEEKADMIQKEHCQKLAYIVEGNTISTRCPNNCACCKSGAKTKTSK